MKYLRFRDRRGHTGGERWLLIINLYHSIKFMQVNAGTKKDAVKKPFGEDDGSFPFPIVLSRHDANNLISLVR